MFFLKTKLLETNNLVENFWVLSGFGVYRRKKLDFFFWLRKKNSKGWAHSIHLIMIKYLILKIFSTLELDSSLKTIHIRIKKSIGSYAGIRHSLYLPIRGQWTWTNASTQRLQGWNPRKWHFVQLRNWRKSKKKKNINQ